MTRTKLDRDLRCQRHFIFYLLTCEKVTLVFIFLKTYLVRNWDKGHERTSGGAHSLCKKGQGHSGRDFD